MNPNNLPIALVSTQYVEDYGIGMGGTASYFKFKGGANYIVRTCKDATAIGVVLSVIAARGSSAGEYPHSVEFFASSQEAIASLPEWQRESVQTVTQAVNA